MSELDTLRGAIDEIDTQIVGAFERRMDVTKKVGEFKKAQGMQVLDSRRQQAVLESKMKLLRNPAYRSDLTILYETIMALSRRQQREIVRSGEKNAALAGLFDKIHSRREPVRNPRVCYQGVPGAYSEEAAVSLFGEDVRTVGLSQFEAVFAAISSGRVDYGVLPIENSSTGAIRQVYDLLTKYDFFLVGETTVRVSHCLAALPDASMESITHVYSHEQGLFQSEQFLSEHPAWTAVPYGDTAGSARYVSDCGDTSKAAICSERAAHLYGLQILARDINFASQNTTRFVVVSPVMEIPDGADKLSAVVTAPHEAGGLHEILTIFAANGMNLLRLESRPVPNQPFSYMFFLEATGNLLDPSMESVLEELIDTAEDIRILGNFRSNLGAAV